MPTIEERFTEKFAGSEDWHRRGRELFAGGVTHQTRFTSPFAVYIEHGEGPLQVRRGRKRAYRLRDGQRDAS